MYLLKKKAVVFLTALSVLCAGVLNIQAAITHQKGCSATLVKVECGTRHDGGVSNLHYLYTTANGEVIICAVRGIYSFHQIKCAGCGVLLKTDSRVCEWVHEDCPNEINVCQY